MMPTMTMIANTRKDSIVMKPISPAWNLTQVCVNSAWDSGNDTAKDDQRYTVSDAVFIDLLTEPHQECGTGGQSQYNNCDREKVSAYQALV